MNYIQGSPRKQLVLFSDSLDSLIPQDMPVRFIDAYVDLLDIKKDLGIIETEGEVGRPAYHQKLFLKLYIYGYLNKVRSSRRLQRECERNIELIWLCEQLTPDFRTISDFRKDHPEAMKKLFKMFLKYCHQLGLLSLETVGIDGTKMRAQNGVSNVYKRETIQDVDKKLDEKIESYLKELEQKDNEDQGGECPLKREQIIERVEALKKAKEKVKEAQAVFNSNPETETVYGHDGDSRLMSDKGKIRPSFNAQTAVDEKHKLIVVAEVTNEANDHNQMTPMLEAVSEVKEELGVEGRTAVEMDCGYYNETNIMAHQDDSEFDIVVPSPKDSKNPLDEKSVPKPAYRAEHFKKESDESYVCPERKKLNLVSGKEGQMMGDKRVWVYRCSDCQGCDKRSRCTKSQQGRSITITENHELMEAFRQKMKTEEYQKKIRQRKELCEHPFGTLKRNFGYDHFLLRGLVKVGGEFSLMSMVYNLRRALNLVSFEKLILVLRTG